MKVTSLFYILCVLLRILGTQLLCPTDEGFQWFATSETDPAAGKESTVKSQEKDKGGTE